MTPLLTALIVGLALAGIFILRPLTAKIKTVFHPNAVIDSQIKFQSMQLILAALALAFVYLLNPVNFTVFFRFGDVNAHIGKIPWLGISGNETWLQVALTLGLFITLGTGIFMFLQVKKAGKTNLRGLAKHPVGKDLGGFIGWAILFSIANAFSEEAIFRMGLVSPLYGLLALPIVALISGILFGLPHYFGQPSGPVGVLMAGFLGWLLALSLLETQGLFIAWAIHFVQDVVIFVSMFAMQAKADEK
ncbi:MAG: CPBP family intramembrane metalloprotease [Chloroflexi bacterium]|nr:CPBP family intramembrane metalloprotease [Chloroflexota bacterium]